MALAFALRKGPGYIEKEGTANAEPDAVWGFDPKAMPASHFHSDTRSDGPPMDWPSFLMQTKQDQ